MLLVLSVNSSSVKCQVFGVPQCNCHVWACGMLVGWYVGCLWDACGMVGVVVCVVGFEYVCVSSPFPW